MISKDLAKLIIDAATIYNKGYDVVGAKKAADAERAAGDSFIDYNQFHTIPLHKACEKACEDVPAMAGFVQTVLNASWNEAIDWAEEQLKEKN